MKFIKILSLLLFTGMAFGSNAAECAITLKKKTGKVYASAPGVIEINKCPAETITIKILKTAGKAKTQVNFYVNGVMQAKVFNFKNGTYKNPQWSVYKIPNAKGKKIKVKVVNQSVGNTFSYDCRFIGKIDYLSIGKSRFNGEMLFGVKKTIYTHASCTNKTNIYIHRRGKARISFKVWEKLPNGQWRELTHERGFMEANDQTATFLVESNRPLKIEIKNVSATGYASYMMSARAG